MDEATHGGCTWLFFFRRMKKKVSKNSMNLENQYHHSALAIYRGEGAERIVTLPHLHTVAQSVAE